MEENFDELKKKAVEYYANNKVPEKLEEILNEMFYENPKDINGRLVGCTALISVLYIYIDTYSILLIIIMKLILIQIYSRLVIKQ